MQATPAPIGNPLQERGTMTVQDAFAEGAGKLGPVDPNPQDPVQAWHRNMELMGAVYGVLLKMQEAIQVLDDLIDPALCRADEAHKHSRARLVHAVIDASGRGMPENGRWYEMDAGPLYDVRSGGKRFIVSRSNGEDPPTPGGTYEKERKIEDQVTLTVVDDAPAEGGGA